MPRLDEEAWLARKERILDGGLRLHQGFPLFSVAELNLVAACTRRCPFCAVADPRYHQTLYADVEPKFLPPELFDKILQNLKAIDYAGELAFSGCSEPLLHPSPELLVARARTVLPAAKILMFSNGDLLSVDALRALFGAGLDELAISLCDGVEQIATFEAMIRRAEIDDGRVILRRRYHDGADYGLLVSNRCGMVDVEKVGGKRGDLPLERECFYPYSFLEIDLNGDVLFCPHNWAKRSIIGNAAHEDVWDIWRNDKIERIREQLSRKDRRGAPCASCDVDGTRTGRKSYELWRGIRNI